MIFKRLDCIRQCKVKLFFFIKINKRYFFFLFAHF